MRHELVHRLTQVGHTTANATLPDRGQLGRVGALALGALRAAVTLAFVAGLTLAVQLATIAVGVALAVNPLAVWIGVLVATAATPTLAARAVLGLAGRA